MWHRSTLTRSRTAVDGVLTLEHPVQPARRTAAFGADGLQLLGLLTTGATIAKKGLHYRCWSKLHPPHARSTPDRPSMSPEQHAVMPRDAHNRGAPCGRGGHGACRVSGAVLLMAMKLMSGGSMVRLGPAAEACGGCRLARLARCSQSKQGNPVRQGPKASISAISTISASGCLGAGVE